MDRIFSYDCIKMEQVKFARNKGERVNPLSVSEGLQAKFAGRGAII